MIPAEPEYVAIGRILSPWGTDGHVRVDVTTDFPERYAPGSKVFVDGRSAVIEDVAWHKGKAIIKLDISGSIADSEKLQGRLLEIHHSQLQALPEDSYYRFQLIGLKVFTSDGEPLGEIADIASSSGHDTYIVRKDGEEVLIPAVGEIVKTVDIAGGCMVIEPIKGLLTLNKKAAH